MKMHKDLEFAVDATSGQQRIFKKFAEACVYAVGLAATNGRPCNIDVLAHSVGAARAWSGDFGVEEYRADPDASVFERIEIKADSKGRVY
jgi:hypothetical protein